MYSGWDGSYSNKRGIFLTSVIRIIIRKVKNKYLTLFISIVIGACVRDEIDGCVTIVKT